MRTRLAWTVAVLGLLGVGSLMWLSAQDTPRPGVAPTVDPVRKPVTVAPSTPTAPTAPATPSPDVEKMTPLQQQMYQAGQRGAGWLARMNETKGRFIPGWQPALAVPLEVNSLMRQAGAAFALARAARYFRDEDMNARAMQAIAVLIQDTDIDSQKSEIRRCSLPTAVVNPVGLSALIVAAIYELPAPNKELLDQAEQLCNYLRTRQAADGSLQWQDDPNAPVTFDPDGINHYPGMALYAVTRSQTQRPQLWKLEMLKKALPYYSAAWKKNRNREFATWQSAAFAEVFAQTKDRTYAPFVLEMNDWICGLQHDGVDAYQTKWYGGFRERVNDREIETAPTAMGACCCESLAEGCRVAAVLGDLERHTRYTACLERGLQYLCTLQYTDADTQHFSAWYRPRVVGGFHLSRSDGTLRLEYTQHAMCALIQYLANAR